MRVAVYGLWHLGCVTAACLASAGHRVVGLDLDRPVVDDLKRGKPPLHEPGLEELIAAETAAGRLSFTDAAEEALADAEVVWVAFDTPVNDRDEADVAFVRTRLEAVAGSLRPGTLLLISSQVPAGFTRALARDWAACKLQYAYSPENLRLGKAIDVFRNPERIVLGIGDPSDKERLTALLSPFCQRLEWMSVESAEMTKHALNAFLATSVTFANEVARLCEAVGADAKEVERGLKSEGRIGPKAYLAPGAAFAGGTLARDVRFLVQFGGTHHVDTPLLSGVLGSNEVHKNWVRDKVRQALGGAVTPVVAVLGLTYKPGTNTLRRSSSVELCTWMHGQGIRVQAHDPAVTALPDELRTAMKLCDTATEALQGADVAVVATEWPAFRELKADLFVQAMHCPQVIDQNHFLAGILAGDARVRYFAIGRGKAQG